MTSHRYRLLYLEPIPGYDAHADELVAAARAVMAVTVEVIDGLNLSLTAVPGAGWVAESDWARNVPPGTSLELDLGFRGVMFWARIHGLIDLELNGNYASMRLDPDVLYEYEMAQLVSGH